MANGQTTGTPDPHYDLISVLYHAVHGSWNYDEYISDAEQAGDDDLASFFRKIKEQNNDLAQEAKRLLKDRIG